MAQTAAQKAAAAKKLADQLAAAKAALAKNKKQLAAAEAAAPAAEDPRIALQKLTSGQALTDAEKVQIGLAENPEVQTAQDPYYTEEVGTTGLTQAQLDAQENAKATATLIGGTVNAAGQVVGPSVDGKSAAQAEAERLAAIAKASQAEADRLAGIAKDSAARAAASAAALKAAQDAQAALDALIAAGKTGATGTGATGTGATGTGATGTGATGTGSTGTGTVPFTSVSGYTPQLTSLDTTASDLYKKYIADLAASKAEADAALYTKREDAYQNLVKTFEAYNLGSLAPRIRDFINQGYGSDTISLLLQETPEYQARFAANEIRKKNGLPVLSPAEYLATERSYTQIMSAAGLPKGFYDSKDDFTKFIAQDVSPSEIKARVDTAADAVANADPFYTSTLKSMYGLTTGDMIAHALDPQMALPLLQKQAAAAKIGTAAARQGWGISQAGAENLYTQGVSQAQAEQGFRTVAGMQTGQQKLAQIWGGDTAAQGQNLVASTFGTAGAAYADQQIKALQQKEIGAFSGGSGAAKGSLGIGVEQTGGGL